jgi:hypothetical protein
VGDSSPGLSIPARGHRRHEPPGPDREDGIKFTVERGGEALAEPLEQSGWRVDVCQSWNTTPEEVRVYTKCIRRLGPLDSVPR